jgi:hypothetical protein
MLKVRSRLVNIRVTDDEFQELKIACDRHGARCMSAFARKVILSTPNPISENCSVKLAALDRRLAVLEVSLSRLSSGLAGSSVAATASEK